MAFRDPFPVADNDEATVLSIQDFHIEDLISNICNQPTQDSRDQTTNLQDSQNVPELESKSPKTKNEVSSENQSQIDNVSDENYDVTSFLKVELEFPADEFQSCSNQTNESILENNIASFERQQIQRRHKGSRFCNICHLIFKTDSLLQEHLREHTDTLQEVSSFSPTKKRKRRNITNAEQQTPTPGRFSCPHCLARFSYNHVLRRHMLIHTGEKPFPCYQCDKTFARKDYLESHLHSHNKEKVFVCPYCDKRYNFKQSLSTHLMVHHTDKVEEKRPEMKILHTCNICQLRFKTDSLLRLHLSGHITEIDQLQDSSLSLVSSKEHSERQQAHKHDTSFEGLKEQEYLQALLCYEDSSGSKDLESHGHDPSYDCGSVTQEDANLQGNKDSSKDEKETQLSHKSNPSFEQGDSNSNLQDLLESLESNQSHLSVNKDRTKTQPPIRKPARFHCPHCPSRFSYKHILRRHLLTHTGEKPYQCSHCEKGFARKDYLEAHLHFHAKEKPFKCPECDNSYTFKTSLETHLRSHVKIEPYCCPKCPKRYSYYSTFKSHLLTHAVDVNELGQCPKCQMKFENQSDLNGHLLVHFDNRSHQCTKCLMSFSRKDKLAQHLKMHQVKNLHECPRCEKSFSLSSNLDRHMLAHAKESHRCPQCPKSFQTEKDLVEHIMTHVGIKPHGCPKCDKSFSTVSTLNYHMKVHADFKAHRCAICIAAFTYRSSLNRHMLVHEDIKPFQCPKCNQSFRRQYGLDIHLIKHDGPIIKPHPCPQCERSYLNKGTLTAHLLTHHNQLKSSSGTV